MAKYSISFSNKFANDIYIVGAPHVLLDSIEILINERVVGKVSYDEKENNIKFVFTQADHDIEIKIQYVDNPETMEIMMFGSVTRMIFELTNAPFSEACQYSIPTREEIQHVFGTFAEYVMYMYGKEQLEKSVEKEN